MTPAERLKKREEIVQKRLEHRWKRLQQRPASIVSYWQETYGEIAPIAYVLDLRDNNKRTFRDTPQGNYMEALARIFKRTVDWKNMDGDQWWATFHLVQKHPQLRGDG